MYTILETGGKQYRVGVGDTIDIETLAAAPGEKVNFDRVLMVVDEDKTLVGRPTLAGVKVVGEVMSVEKGPKVVVFKFKRRKNQRRKTGHRQTYTRVAIREIAVG